MTRKIKGESWEKCDAFESEILDKLHDEDARGLASGVGYSAYDYGVLEPVELTTPIQASQYELEEFFNQILGPICPKHVEIFMDRAGLWIIDKKHNIERYYSLQTVEPTTRKDSITKIDAEFMQLREDAKKAINEIKEVRRGEWYKLPGSKYDRYQLLFEAGGTVPCGLPDGTDCVPAHFNDRDFLIGQGEYLFSRPAVAAMSDSFDLIEGTKILHHIHEQLRLRRGREEAHRRTYG